MRLPSHAPQNVRRHAWAVWIGTGSAALALMGLVEKAAAQAPGIVLQPHRISYEVSLGPRKAGAAFNSARGLMVLEFTGSACAGFTTNFRQVTELADAEGRAHNLDFRINLWEEGAGKRFRFTIRNSTDGTLTRDAEGEGRRADDGSMGVTIRKPQPQKSDYDGDVQFPAAMSIKLIAAAIKGERNFAARLFDGSEGGAKIYDVNATIGQPLRGPQNARLEPVMKGPALDSLQRWPVSIAYYEDVPGDRVPAYTMRSVTFENGVVSDLLFEFPEFSLAARAKSYEALPAAPCGN